VDIKLTEVKKAVLYLDNVSVQGQILNVDKNDGKVTFELKPDSPISAAEMGKKGEVFFEYTGNKYFISGKTFFQSHSTVLITPETGIDIDKRTELRLEVPSLPGTISYTSGVFHKKHTIKCTVINMSLKGARLETSESLSNEMTYAIEISFPYHHTTINFLASFMVKNCRHYRNIYIHGASFINMDSESEDNLKKYLFGGKKLF
jgi:hypothetical protein